MIPLYPEEKLYKEMSFIAYHFHWPIDTIISLEHRERIKWCNEISQINEQLNKTRIQ